MFKNLVILTLISLHNVSINAHVHKINNYTTTKVNCILYEYPNKKYCDYYYNNSRCNVEKHDCVGLNLGNTNLDYPHDKIHVKNKVDIG